MSRRKLVLPDDGDEVRIEFPYDPSLLPVVRNLSRRRFDRGERCWFCPREVLVEAVDVLVPHGFAPDEAVEREYRARGGSGPTRATAAPEPGSSLFDAAPARRSPAAAAPAVVAETASPDSSLSVRELNRRVKAALRREFPQELWVVGEVVGFDRNSHRPTVHFELAEKDGEGDDAEVAATVSAVLFGRARGVIEDRLGASPEPFELRDGLAVRLKVRVDLYEVRGGYQLIVEDIDPVHTLGRIAQSRARVLAELDRRGLRERNLGLPMPLVPLRIGLVTSQGSDAMNDFVGELERSGFAFELTLADARMQGRSLQREVIGALKAFERKAEQFDVVAIVRGGGSKSDLAWFDDLQVALAVAQCPFKVVIGIGHHRDVSVLDLIAHREKTPTAAAALLVEQVRDYDRRLVAAGTQLVQRARRRLQEDAARLRAAGRRLERSSRGKLQLAWQRFEHHTSRLVPAAARGVREQRRTLQEKARLLETRCAELLARRRAERGRAQQRLATAAQSRLRLEAHSLAGFQRGLAADRFQRWVEARGRRLDDLGRAVSSADPRCVLRRGFALIRDEAGRTVRDAGSVELGGRLQAQLARGALELEVRERRPAPAEDPETTVDPEATD